MSSVSSTAQLNLDQLSKLARVVSSGFESAAAGLSDMVNKEIKVVTPGLRLIPMRQAPGLVGEPDTEVVAVYLRVWGDADGHILLILSLEAADDLVGMLMGKRDVPGGALIELEQSALGEVANVTGSFFLSSLADSTGLLLQPSPPAVMIDMVGAVLDVPLISLGMSTEEVLFIDTWFIDQDRQIKGLFLMLPTVESLSLIVKKLDSDNG